MTRPLASPNLLFHPKNILLFFLLMGLSAMFVALTASYVYSRVQSDVPPVKVPLIFIANAFLLLAGSWAMRRAKRAYLDDDTEAYKRSLLWTIGLSIVFLVSQILGWRWLFLNQQGLISSITTSYLYVISILHFLHVVAGLPFLLIFYQNAKKRMIEPVSVLVYFSDPEKRLNLRLLSIYWHFLDGLWLYLVAFFLVNRLIS